MGTGQDTWGGGGPAFLREAATGGPPSPGVWTTKKAPAVSQGLGLRQGPDELLKSVPNTQKADNVLGHQLQHRGPSSVTAKRLFILAYFLLGLRIHPRPRQRLAPPRSQCPQQVGRARRFLRAPHHCHPTSTQPRCWHADPTDSGKRPVSPGRRAPPSPPPSHR